MGRQSKFYKLGWYYILAMSCIAVCVIFGYFVIQNQISRQLNDSQLINTAGKQRMLSQKISTLVLQIEQAGSREDRQLLATELDSILHIWIKSNSALSSVSDKDNFDLRKSPGVAAMFDQIQPHYQAIVTSVGDIIALVNLKTVPEEELKRTVDIILEHEPHFLAGMDHIVLRYQHEAQSRISALKQTALMLLTLTLILILIEIIFIFRPTARDVRKTVSELMASEEKSLSMSGELSRLYEELLNSYQELEAVNLKPEISILYATIDVEGKFTYLSNQFLSLMEYDLRSVPTTLAALLSGNGYSDEFTEGLLSIINEEKTWNGEVRLTSAAGDFYWLELYIVPVRFENIVSHKVIGRNITEIKEARMRSREINLEKIEKRVREQEYRSVLILEGQEEERQRLGREIHDGIGQMLTALKLSLESITPSSSKHTVKRLKDARILMKNILEEVRRISFNLIPSSLTDFGIVAAVKKFCQEVDKFSASEVIFENKTRFVNRLDQHLENNLYRIIQEAVNNAVKYARARQVKVIFEHDPDELTIVIEDNGKGFDYNDLNEKGHFKHSGHGIFNMRERAAFIHSDFQLISKPGKGTRIILKLPLNRS